MKPQKIKPLDDVIKAWEFCPAHPDTCEGCPYEKEYRDIVGAYGCYLDDALHYLKEYRDGKAWLELEKRNYAEGVANCERAEAKYTQMILDANRNDPLSWSELKQMEMMPIWIESLEDIVKFSGWTIVRDVTDSVLFIIVGDYDGAFFVEEIGLPRCGIGKTWNAYREERK